MPSIFAKDKRGIIRTGAVNRIKILLLRLIDRNAGMPPLMIEPEPSTLEAWRVLLRKARKS